MEQVATNAVDRLFAIFAGDPACVVLLTGACLLLYAVIYLVRRGERDRREMVELVKNNTEAMTRLAERLHRP